MPVTDQVLQYLLQTGPITLSDLVTRMPDIPQTLHSLIELESSKKVEIKGDRAALTRLIKVVDDASGGAPEAIRQRFFEGLKEIAAANDIKVRLSQSGFRRTSQAPFST